MVEVSGAPSQSSAQGPARSLAEDPAQTPSVEAAQHLVGVLIAAGVRDAVIAPGSRSAPLVPVLAAAEAAGQLCLRVMIDERSAGFTALGMAKAYQLRGEQRPAAVIVTSGTAVANLHPAVLEADAAGVPLIVVSADRPHELVGTGASQTTRQVGLFGPALRAEVDLPADLPRDLGRAAAPAIAGQVRRAVAAATGEHTAHPGPVQINARFRPPLTPAPGLPAVPIVPPWEAMADGAAGLPADLTTLGACQSGDHRGTACERGLVVAGDALAAVGAVARELAEFLGWPLLAEPTSGARAGRTALRAYSPLLASEAGQALVAQAQRIVVVGHPSLTRPVSALLARTDVPIEVLSVGPAWTDVAGTATAVLPLPGDLHPGAGEAFARARGYAPAPADWLESWHEADEALVAAQGGSGPTGRLTAERAALRAWEASLAENRVTVVGSSMAIRYLDRLAPSPDEPLRAVANRGLAGIDGTLATATGVWHVLREPVRVILGDLTFAHDAMSLSHGALEAAPHLQIVLLDDVGGGIFSTLEYPGVLEEGVMRRFFTTPQAAQLGALGAALGARVVTARTQEELDAALAQPVEGLCLIHVCCA